MTHSIIFLALASALSSTASAAPSKVAKVVVYPDRALVTRQTQLACGPRAIATFTAIPPSADPASFRAKSSAGSIDGLRFEERTREDVFSPERKDADQKARALELELRGLREDRARLQATARVSGQYLEQALGLIDREMNDAAPNVKGWDVAFQSALDARQKSGTRLVDSNGKVRELEHKLEDLQRKLARLESSGSRHEYQAEVLVTCPSGRNAVVDLTYTVGGASWEPAYEARADEGGGAVEMSTLATVRQTTGEDWREAQVILSTAVPRENATPPELSPLNVWAEERTPPKKVIVARQELTEHAEAGASAAQVDTGGRVRAAGQGLSVELVVPDPSDIPGDGSPARLFVARTRMKARFAYRAAPTLMPFVFRVADLSNTAPFPLLAGPVDAFRRTGLTSRYPLERVAEGGAFHLTFGIEESMRAKRVTVEEVQRDKGLFGTTRRFRYEYRFEVANYEARTEELEVSDRVAVSELDDVKVSVDSATTAGYELHADDGIVLWRVKLAPGEKRDLHLAFHIDVPSSYDSGAM